MHQLLTMTSMHQLAHESTQPLSCDHAQLADFSQIDHLTVEVNRCEDCDTADSPRNGCAQTQSLHQHDHNH